MHHSLTALAKINNTQVDNAKQLDVAMPMHNLTEYSDNYSKANGSLWQYHRDEPAAAIANSESFKSKMKITGKTPPADNTKYVKIAIQYNSIFWRTLGMP